MAVWMYVWMYAYPTFSAKVFMDFSPYGMGYFLAFWGMFQAKKKLTCPSPFFEVFWSDFSRIFGAHVSAHLRLSGLDFYVSGIFRIISRGYFFVWPNFDFWALGRGVKVGVTSGGHPKRISPNMVMLYIVGKHF